MKIRTFRDSFNNIQVSLKICDFVLFVFKVIVFSVESNDFEDLREKHS